MSWPTWLALAVAVWVAPLGDVPRARLRELARAGRLVAAPPAGRPVLTVRPVAVAAPIPAALGAGVVVTLAFGPVLGVAAAGVAATAVHLVRGSLRRRVAARTARRLLAAVRVVVAELEAGAALGTALRAGAELCPEHAASLIAAAEDGADPAVVLSADDALRPLGHACRLALSAGAPPASVLDRVADDLASAIDQGRAVSGALAGPRSSTAVLAGLPVVGVLLGASLDADPMRFLLGSAAGQLVCLAGIVLDVVGIVWTQRLTVRAEAG